MGQTSYGWHNQKINMSGNGGAARRRGICRWGCRDRGVSRNRSRLFLRSLCSGFVGKGVLFALEVSRYQLLGDVAPLLPSWFLFSGPLGDELQ